MSPTSYQTAPPRNNGKDCSRGLRGCQAGQDSVSVVASAESRDYSPRLVSGVGNGVSVNGFVRRLA